jgi:hypothetical protein
MAYRCENHVLLIYMLIESIKFEKKKKKSPTQFKEIFFLISTLPFGNSCFFV